MSKMTEDVSPQLVKSSVHTSAEYLDVHVGGVVSVVLPVTNDVTSESLQ